MDIFILSSQPSNFVGTDKGRRYFSEEKHMKRSRAAILDQ
jgi:hypothetical protein